MKKSLRALQLKSRSSAQPSISNKKVKRKQKTRKRSPRKIQVRLSPKAEKLSRKHVQELKKEADEKARNRLNIRKRVASRRR